MTRKVYKINQLLRGNYMDSIGKSFVVLDMGENVGEMKRIEKYKGYKDRSHENTRCLHVDK